MHLNVTESYVGIPKEKSTSNTFLFQHITNIYHKSAGLQVCKSASLRVCRSAVCVCRTPEVKNLGYPRCNIIYSFSLFYGLLLGFGLLSRMFCFLCFTSAVRNKLYYASVNSSSAHPPPGLTPRN